MKPECVASIEIKQHSTTLQKAGIMNLIVVGVRSRTNSVQVYQNRFFLSLLFASEKTDFVRELLKQDYLVTHHEIEEFLDISMKCINKILHEHLAGKKKVCLRWIPANMTNAQKRFMSIGARKCQQNMFKMH